MTARTAGSELDRGRRACARSAWKDGHDALAAADRRAPLGADDLELLATAAYMLGREAEYLGCLERAHHAHLDAGEDARAVRCTFWLALTLTLRGKAGPATGWLGRGQRLLAGRDSVEQGYLRTVAAEHRLEEGDLAAADAELTGAAEIAERFGDADLLAMAVHDQGKLRIKQGRAAEGLRLMDEAMVAVTSGGLSPIVTGLMYCSMIDGCQEVHAVGRAREWTAALTQWCARQPDMIAFTGVCLVHRAELMQLDGAWRDALEEARRAAGRGTATGKALYRQGELHRLRGELAAAEDAYREASRHGYEPQPGLALLRLVQGKPDAAAAAIRRVVTETAEEPRRTALLPACVEIMLATGDLDAARGACAELESIAGRHAGGMTEALAAHARGAVELAGGDAEAALVALRRAATLWQELGVPYEAARARVLLARACRALRDGDAAALELEAARGVFERLGAAPDLASTAPSPAHGLTPRELEVLRRVAGGRTNKAIAAELVLSERTVDRHVSNILAKLRVPSRAAATAYAYEHELV
jgi:DNA-binding CsgD family transcriptional regulator